jgi:hypothetical protein
VATIIIIVVVVFLIYRRNRRLSLFCDLVQLSDSCPSCHCHCILHYFRPCLGSLSCFSCLRRCRCGIITCPFSNQEPFLCT